MITIAVNASGLHPLMANPHPPNTMVPKTIMIPKGASTASFSMGQKAVPPLVPHVSMEPTVVPYGVAPTLLNHVSLSSIPTI